jgi:hypothetical protein
MTRREFGEEDYVDAAKSAAERWLRQQNVAGDLVDYYLSKGNERVYDLALRISGIRPVVLRMFMVRISGSRIDQLCFTDCLNCLIHHAVAGTSPITGWAECSSIILEIREAYPNKAAALECLSGAVMECVQGGISSDQSSIRAWLVEVFRRCGLDPGVQLP